MAPRKRQPGERRWGMPVDFPLTDQEGRHIRGDRRSGVDRRKAAASLEELLIMLSRLASDDPEGKR